MKYKVTLEERCVNIWEVEVEADCEEDARDEAEANFSAGETISGEVIEVTATDITELE